MRKLLIIVVVILTLLFGIGLVFRLASGGAPELVPTPNLYADSEANPFADVPVEFRNNQVDVLYVTDRHRVDGGETGKVAYDYRRSTSMAFGSAVIQYGGNVTWDELVKASRRRKRDVSLRREIPPDAVAVRPPGRLDRPQAAL